jgi:hypothetical protein
MACRGVFTARRRLGNGVDDVTPTGGARLLCSFLLFSSKNGNPAWCAILSGQHEGKEACKMTVDALRYND